MTRTRLARSSTRLLRRLPCEHLEPRLVMAAAIATNPPSGASLAQSPDTLSVTFDQPIDPFSLNFGDVTLEQIAADGTIFSLFDPNLPPPESLDSSGTILSVPVDQPLTPGHYRFVLSGMSGLTDLNDGSLVAPSDGSDQVLSDFTIVNPGVRLVDAVNLGTAGPTVASVAGSLDFVANPLAVNLYKFTLSSGHNWRLGLEVSAQQDGSNLDAALTLFDDQGHPIGSDDSGLPDAPKDPFLFQGLAAGTYYIGVSGVGNLAGFPGAYDPATGDAGSILQTQPGGAYHLNIVADAADQSTQLTGFRVDHADPLDSDPSGFTLQFSGPLAVGNWSTDSHLNPMKQLQVVDTQGKAWDLGAASYDAALGRLSYGFAEVLPEGDYSVVLPSLNGLTDLAGHAPIAPGQPSGVLANFHIGANQILAPGNLGWIPMDGNHPTTVSSLLAPGTSTNYQFTVAFQGFYRIGSDGDPASITSVVQSTDPAAIMAPPDTNNQQRLNPGTYILTITNTGLDPAQVQSFIQLNTSGNDSLLTNGIGQGSALNLRLVAPADLSPVTPPSSTSTTTSSDLTISSSTISNPPTATSILPSPVAVSSATLSSPAAVVGSVASTPPPTLASPIVVATPAAMSTPAPASAASIAALASSVATLASSLPTPTPMPTPSSPQGPPVGPIATNPAAELAFSHSTGESAPSREIGAGPALIGNATADASATPKNPSGLYLALGGALVGRPSPEADHAAVVGPGSSTSAAVSVAIAGGTPGQALAVSFGAGFSHVTSDAWTGHGEGHAPEPSIDGAVPAEVAALTSESGESVAALDPEVTATSFQDELASARVRATPPAPVDLEPVASSSGETALLPPSEPEAASGRIAPTHLAVVVGLAWGSRHLFARFARPRTLVAGRVRRGMSLSEPIRGRA